MLAFLHQVPAARTACEVSLQAARPGPPLCFPGKKQMFLEGLGITAEALPKVLWLRAEERAEARCCQGPSPVGRVTLDSLGII